MPRTVKKFGEKSMISQNDLVFRRNFWDFYLINKKILDQYLNFVIFKNSNYMPVDDFKQEILMSLADKDILKQYDPKRSKLCTFITYWFYWEAGHIVQKTKKERKQIPISRLKEKIDSKDQDFIISEKSKADDTIVYNEFISKLKQALPTYQQNILDLLKQEFSQSDIAAKFDNSPAYINQNMHDIRNKALRILKDQLPTACIRTLKNVG